MAVSTFLIQCSVLSVLFSVYDRLVNQAPRQPVDRARRLETLVPHHPDEREILNRIDPEPRAGDAEPRDSTVEDRNASRGRIHHILKVNSPARPLGRGLQRIRIEAVGL